MSHKVEIRLIGYDRKQNEGYSDYLLRVSTSMVNQAKLLQETESGEEYDKLHTQFKHYIEQLVSIIYEREHIMD